MTETLVQHSKSNLSAALIYLEAPVKGPGGNYIDGFAFPSKTFTDSQTVVASNDVQIMLPSTCLLLVQLASGQLTLNGMLSASGNPSFGSPTFTTGAITDTNLHPVLFNTSNSTPVVSFQGVSGSAGAVVQRWCLLRLDLVPSGGGYHELAQDLGALVQAGTGVFDFLAT